MNASSSDLPDLRGRTAIVTGANSGIGYRTTLGLAQAGARVVLACRDVVRGTTARDRIRAKAPGAHVDVAGLDLASMSSVRSFAGGWTGPLDLLVNNAGVMAPPRPVTTEDGFELQFGTNHLGHYALTGLLLPALLAAPAARVVTVSSIAHHGGDAGVLDGNTMTPTGYDPQHAYSNSKLANLLFALELERQAREHGVALTSTAAHPGVAATALASDREGMGARPMIRTLAPVLLRVFTASARAGARSVLFAATAAEPGSYTGPQWLGETRGPVGAARRSPCGQDDELAARLWQVSEELTGLRYDWP